MLFQSMTLAPYQLSTRLHEGKVFGPFDWRCSCHGVKSAGEGNPRLWRHHYFLLLVRIDWLDCPFPMYGDGWAPVDGVIRRPVQPLMITMTCMLLLALRGWVILVRVIELYASYHLASWEKSRGSIFFPPYKCLDHSFLQISIWVLAFLRLGHASIALLFHFHHCYDLNRTEWGCRFIFQGRVECVSFVAMLTDCKVYERSL